MEGLFAYLKERGGVVNKNIQEGKTPTEDQLNSFTRETVAKFKQLVKDAPDHVKSKVMLPWAPLWDYDKNAPGKGGGKLDAPKLLDILKRIRDSLSQAPAAKQSAPARVQVVKYRVSGAGNSAINGVYREVADSKTPKFVHVSESENHIELASGKWKITKGEAILYQSDKVEGTAPPCGFDDWTVNGGADGPAPRLQLLGGPPPAKKEEEPKEEVPKKFHGAVVEEMIDIDSSMIGRIVGPKGATMKMLQEASECKIDINQDVVNITGPEDGMPIAVKAIKELCEKGFCALAYGDDFTEQAIQVHPIYFSELIGKQGCVIRGIKDQLNVELSIPKLPPGAKVREMTRKMKVGFAGRKENVEKAKDVVENIVQFYHHELTHPGDVHEEMEVEPHQTRFIIGKGGSESKHIQNSYKVKMYIPNEHSANQKLLIVGEQKNVEAACKYVENALIKADERAKAGNERGNAGGAEDFWGEETAEPWMNQYMYKRK